MAWRKETGWERRGKGGEEGREGREKDTGHRVDAGADYLPKHTLLELEK